MGMPEYRGIIEAYCDRTGIADVEAVLQQGAITVHGAPVWLRYVEPADLCRIVVDLGAADEGMPPQVWRAMLEFNYTNRSDFLPTLSMNPADGHAVLVLHAALSRLSREQDLPKWLDEHLAPAIDAWHRVFEMARHGRTAGQYRFGDGFA